MPREVQDMLIEMDALHAANRTLNALPEARNEEALNETILLVRRTFETYISTEPETIEDHIILRATARILNEEVPLFDVEEPSPEPPEQHSFEVVGKAWIDWASQKPLKAPITTESTSQASGAIHLSMLQLWGKAVQELFAERLLEAQRLWKRSLEIGSSFGTPSSPSVLWSYCATFWPEAWKSSAHQYQERRSACTTCWTEKVCRC